ncbi:zinc finger SWIM domain-containing protein 8 isoform X2 [Octopus sinensis]|uniref:Zinc finger SWIM domain-containing protein 8 isoform X2 n=1 Tax=Octopus sinensis TaxID=2607531 RepID=A0A7E6EV49_9MOLL|nr:zinc finger SWIM domain-containing protein 8 isoform X2 [Octopus sinensis]
MHFMFDWETEADHISFDDSDRFEEDSLCSWNSEPESLCNNWRGWKRQNGGQAFPAQQQQQQRTTGDKIVTLVEMSAQAVACHIPFEVVENFRQPVPDQLQLRIAFWSFPENEEDIRLYSCLANGSSDEFQKGEHLYKMKAVKEALQIGFHLSATVDPSQSSTQGKGSYNVAVVFDRRRITSCMCTCGSTAWCSHVVALCLYRIHQSHSVCLRAPVSESLSRLRRDQLQKFAQYLISELPQQILPTAQKLLDELLSSQETAMNTVYGAPDPTAGPSASEQTSWCLDPDTLHENIKKTLVKHCLPTPMVFSDVNYLSSSAPPAAAEWQSLLRPLRGREPEGMWNLLSIVREMFRRSDNNAVPLLEILTDEVLQCEQILVWWFATKMSSSHSGNSNHVNRCNSNSSANASQHAAASFCDEIVTLWRLAALNPKLSPIQRDDLCTKFRDWHISTIDKVKKIRGSSFGIPVSLKKTDIENFCGFKPAVEACSLDWEEYNIPGITYSEGLGTQYHISRIQETETKKLSRVQTVAVCSQDLISSDSSTRCTHPAMNFDPTTGTDLREPHYFFKSIPGPGLMSFDVGNMDSVLSSGSEGFCEPDKSDTETTRNSSSSNGKNKVTHQESIDNSEYRGNCQNYKDKNLVDSVKFSVVVSDTNGDSDASLPGTSGCQNGAKTSAHSEQGGESPRLEPSLSAESQPSSDEYQLYFYDTKVLVKSSESEKKKKDKTEEPNYFFGLKTSYSKQDIWFARAEALHTHGHNKEACKLAQKLAEEILANPPDFLAEANTISAPKGKKKKLQNSVSLLASQTLAKAAFLCNVLSEDPDCYPLAFNIAMFGLEMPRPPASNKVLEVKLAYQESELLTLLKKIPLGQSELNILREKAEQLRDGKLQSRGEALLPLTLASFIFDLFCMPASPACGNNGKSPNRSQSQVLTKLPSYEKLGFEAAVAALGLKANVSEAEHPLLCEGTRRQRGDLAITMLVHYKDDQAKLSKIIDKLLDKEVHQMYKAPSLSTYLSNKSGSHQSSSTTGSTEAGAKRTKFGSCSDPNTTSSKSSSTQHSSTSSSSSSQQHVKEDDSSTTTVTAAAVSTTNTISSHSASSAGRLDLPQSGMLMGSSGSVGGDPDQSGWQNSPAQRLDYLNLEQGQATSNHSTGARPKTMYSLKYNSGKDTDSSALEEDGDDLKALEARIRCMTLRKKPSQGMASIDSSAPETTSSDNSPTLIRRSWSKHQGPGSDSGSSGKSSDSLGSSSSEEKVAVNCNKVRENESLTNPFLARITSLVLIDTRMPSTNMKTIRYKGKRIIPTTPNQPSEASAHFMFELAKNVLFKAGGNSSTSLFTRPPNNNNPTGPHRNLHLCAFQIGLYALGLHNCVSPNWLSRTYSSHVSWITGQAMEIGSAAINILIDTWEGHLTPPEVASLADRASRGRDPNMVKAASELSLSSLPHAHALNPIEVQRALLQCKEHSKEMLEKACLAVESAAKGGGVYPEVLFEVARHWDKMAEESAHLSNNGSAQDLSVALEASHSQDEDSNRPLMVDCVGDQINPSSNTSSALPMITYNQQPSHTSTNSQVSTQGTPPPPPQIILHSSNHMNHPGPMVIPYTLPGPAQNGQMPHHPTTYVPTYSIFNHHHHHQYPPPPPPPPQTTHIPLHNNLHHPGAYITTYSYQNQSPFPVGNLQNIQNVHQNTAQIFSNGTNIRHLGPTMQIYPNPNCQLGSLQPVHGGNTATATAGNNVQHVDQPPVFTPCQPTSSNCVPGQQQGPLCVGQQQQQPVGQSNIQTPSAINNQTQMNYLMAAYRVGMLAMETLGRNDRPHMKYARNPPYGEDVKRLLGVAIKLGSSYLQQFCASAVNAVVSPFVLYDIAWEAAHYLAHNNQTPVHNCLRSNFLNPLVQKCIQMFMHCAHHRIHHITSPEYDDFVSIICTAQKAFCMSPGGPVQFNELLQSLRRSKSCRKELWQKIVNGLTRGACNVTSSKISL